MAASIYEDIVKATVREFSKNMSVKVREQNTFKLSMDVSSSLKKVISYPIHRLVFAKSFGAKLTLRYYII